MGEQHQAVDTVGLEEIWIVDGRIKVLIPDIGQYRRIIIKGQGDGGYIHHIYYMYRNDQLARTGADFRQTCEDFREIRIDTQKCGTANIITTEFT